MKILIIGGNGFIGFHLAELLSKNNKVIIFDEQINKSKYKNKNIFFCKRQYIKLESVKKDNERIDIVFNFAAVADIDIAAKIPFKTAEINILGSINIFKACIIQNVKKIIHASTIYVNSNEGNFYAISKRCAEEYLLQFNKNNKLKIYHSQIWLSLWGKSR